MSVCRICLDGASDTRELLSPCACRGASKFVHMDCLIAWCERREHSVGKEQQCELCQQNYTGPAALALARHHFRTADKLGEEHPKALGATFQLAKELARDGQNTEALKLYRYLLPIYERRSGKSHVDTLTVASALALALGRVGQQKEALAIHERTLGKLREVRGEDDVHTQAEMNNYAMLLSDIGRHDEAVRLFQASLASRKRKLGSEHPETLSATANLAVMLAKIGCLAEAKEYLERTVPSCERVLGKEHPLSTSVRSNLDAAQKMAATEGPQHGQAHRQTEEVSSHGAAGDELSTRGQNGGEFVRQKRPRQEPRTEVSSRGVTGGEPGSKGKIRAGPLRRKCPREEFGDEVFALLLQLGVSCDNAMSYLPLFLKDGFDSIPAFRTLTAGDLTRMSIKEGDRKLILKHLRK